MASIVFPDPDVTPSFLAQNGTRYDFDFPKVVWDGFKGVPYSVMEPPAVFDPTDIVSLKHWYDAQDLSTLWSDDGVTQAIDGGLVERWDDKSGSGYHIIVGTGNAPSLDLSTHDNNAVAFRTNQKLSNIGGIVDTYTDVTIMAVHYIKSVSLLNERIISFNATGASDGFDYDGFLFFMASNTSIGLYHNNQNFFLTGIGSHKEAVISSKLTIDFRSAGRAELFINNVFNQFDTKIGGTILMNPNDFTMCGREEDTSRCVDADMMETFIFNAPLSAEELFNMESYIYNKYPTYAPTPTPLP